MKKFFAISMILATTAFAHASEVTVLSTTVPAARGYTDVDTRFYVDTDMKEVFAKVEVTEAVTVYVRDCSGGYYGPYNPRYPRPYPGNYYCRTIPQTRYSTILSDRVKIDGMTMNGDEVIYQGQEGDVVCGKMGRSRVFRVPTFYLSGNCSLEGSISQLNGIKTLTVKFKTK